MCYASVRLVLCRVRACVGKNLTPGKQTLGIVQMINTYTRRHRSKSSYSHHRSKSSNSHQATHELSITHTHYDNRGRRDTSSDTLEARAIIPSGLGSIHAHSPRLSLVADAHADAEWGVPCRAGVGPGPEPDLFVFLNT